MRTSRYRFNFNELRLTIELDQGRGQCNFSIHDRSDRINFDFEDFDRLMQVIEFIGNIDNIKEREKQVSLNDYIRFHRVFIADTSSSYNYEINITEREKQRNVGHSVYLKGIKELNLVKDCLIELHKTYLEDKWLDEKIKNAEPQFVEYNGEKIEVEKKYGRLLLSKRGIKKISDIKGLKDIKYLKILNLHDNEIKEIEGIDHLIYLRNLSLSYNYIKKIKGLDTLKNLEELHLAHNPIASLEGLEQLNDLQRLNLSGTLIPKEIFLDAGINDPTRAEKIIDFLKNNKERELKRELNKDKTIEYVKKASSVFEEISYSKIIDKTGININDLEELVEDLIFSGKINAKIRKDGIAFIEENPLLDIALETVDVLHEIKDDAKLISQYTSYIEELFDKTENIEEYLKTHLASEFEKIKDAWQDYKEGKIDKRELIKTGIKQIGKKFVKIFVKKI